MAAPRKRLGPPLGTRKRAMRFTLWALALDHTPTVQEVANYLEISLMSARDWRTDWLNARAPAAPSGARL